MIDRRMFMPPIPTLIRTCLSLTLLSSALPTFAAAPFAAEVVSLTGQGDYRPPRTEQWSPASIKLQLQAESQVRTGLASTIGLLLADQAQIKLGQNSVFQVRAVAAGNSGTRLWLQQGKAWSQTKNAANGLSMETPTMTAGIHGTDWLLEVAEDGSTTITVLSGLVAVSNPYGAVEVGKNETATTTPGQPPIKRRLLSTADRVQWVSQYRLNPADYPEWGSLIGSTSDWQTRVPYLQRHLVEYRQQAPQAAAWLLGAELAAWAGDGVSARQLIEQGQQLFPGETRFNLLRAKQAFALGDVATANRLLHGVPPSFSRAMLQAELAHYVGHAQATEAAYREAIAIAPDRPEAWQGLGRVLAEREAFTAANHALQAAASRGGDEAKVELGFLATLADQPTIGREAFQGAIDANPSDYLAWTGLGVAELKAGNNDRALDALLRANTIEPRYARPVVYTAVAYYRQGKTRAALDTLNRAAELDPNDPLPYRVMAIMARDRWLPDQALAADLTALRLQPKLRSLNQLAVDRSGNVELGGALADLGLANWANRLAQDGYYPYWAGSHLFLANQYAQGLAKESELLQGLLTDPTVFGSHGVRQSILVTPGMGGDVGASAYRVSGSTVYDSHARLNGYSNTMRPTSWLAEVGLLHQVPGGGVGEIGSDQRTATLGFGSKLTPTLGAFVYANRQQVDLRSASDAHGDSWRIDTGLGWHAEPQTLHWLKIGAGEDTSEQQNPQAQKATTVQRTTRRQDMQWRVTARRDNGIEHALGVETWRTQLGDHTRQVARNTNFVDVTDDDRGQQLWSSLGAQMGEWQWQTDLAWQHYAKDKLSDQLAILNTGTKLETRIPATREQRGLYPRLGVAWQANQDVRLRAVWQDWVRPASLNTLMPVATLGVPLADAYVLPGGHQQRCRLQADWQQEKSLFTVFAEHLTVHNLHVIGDLDNNQKPLTSLTDLGVGELGNFVTLEALESPSAFSDGEARNVGAQLDWLLSPSWSTSVGYIHSDAQSLGSKLGQPGRQLPYVPAQRARLMLTWTTSPVRIQGELLWRSKRTTSELAAGVDLPANLQSRLAVQWRSDDAHWQLNSYLRYQTQVKNPMAIGATLDWRF